MKEADYSFLYRDGEPPKYTVDMGTCTYLIWRSRRKNCLDYRTTLQSGSSAIGLLRLDESTDQLMYAWINTTAKDQSILVNGWHSMDYDRIDKHEKECIDKLKNVWRENRIDISIEEAFTYEEVKDKDQVGTVQASGQTATEPQAQDEGGILAQTEARKAG